MAELVDEERMWLAALVAGDYKAFEMLYNKYRRMLYSFALNLSKNPHEAEELVQSVFVTVWEVRETIDPEKQFNAFLFSIARNRFYNLLQKRVIENCYADYILLQNNLIDDTLEKQIEDNEINEIIHKLLQKVPERRQEIFRLRHEESLSYKQIAEKLRISENTVDTQIRNVLNYLRKELPKYLKLFLILGIV